MPNPDDESTQPQIPSPPPYQPMYPPPAPPQAAVPPPPPPPAATAPYAAAAAPPPAVPPRAETRHQRESRRRALSALAVVFFLIAAAFVGYTMGSDNGSNSTNAAGSFPSSQSQFPGLSGGSGSSGSSSSGSGSNGQQSSIDVNGIAAKVSPSIVNLTSALDNGEAAGTGIVVSPSGLVLTNNHVIAYTNELQAEIGGDGNEHTAKVLGYDIADDVALVQIEDVSGLTAAPIGDSSSLQIGDAVVALGNAGGKGGSPTVVSGSVTALDQQITASDQDGSNAEQLSHLIQINANIQPGDSGGPLVDSDGKVVGMDSAASSGNGGFGFGGQSSNEGYAIPIENAMQIAKQIQSGNADDSVHIGGHRALLGVGVQDNASGSGSGNDPFGGDANGQSSGSGNGAYVTQVQSGSGADSAGLQQGDTITGLDGTTITSAQQLTHSLVKYSPNDKVSVKWVDSSGDSHTATIELGSGSPA